MENINFLPIFDCIDKVKKEIVDHAASKEGIKLLKESIDRLSNQILQSSK